MHSLHFAVSTWFLDLRSSWKSYTSFPFQNVWSIKSLVCVSVLQMVLVLLTCLNYYSVSYTTLFFWHPQAQNPAIQTWPSHFLALDPTFGIHSHKTSDTAQPCYILKPNWKPSSSHNISAPTNINTQFLLQSVSVCVCVCVCVCVFPYNTLCELFF